MSLKKPQIEQDIEQLKQSVQDINSNMDGDAISLQGKTVPIPTTNDDGKVLTYDVDTNSYILAQGTAPNLTTRVSVTENELRVGQDFGTLPQTMINAVNSNAESYTDLNFQIIYQDKTTKQYYMIKAWYGFESNGTTVRAIDNGAWSYYTFTWNGTAWVQSGAMTYRTAINLPLSVYTFWWSNTDVKNIIDNSIYIRANFNGIETLKQEMTRRIASLETSSTNIGNATKIQGKTVATPTSTDDEKALVYDNDTSSFKYVAMPTDTKDAVTIQGKAVPSPTATDDGKALVYDDTTSAFKYATASGGTTDISDTLTAEDLAQGEVVGQPTSIYYANPVDKPPATPNAHDYEFESSDTTSLPTGWSWVNQQTATYRERNGRGIIYYPTLTAVQVIGIERALSTDSTWEYCAKIDFACWGVNFFEYDMFLRDSTTNKMLTFSMDGRGLTYKKWNTPTSWNSETGFYPVSYGRSPMYLKIRRNSNTSYDFLYSYDGIEWLAMFSALDLSTWSSNFDKIGIGFSANTDSNKGGIGYMYWFRRTK